MFVQFLMECGGTAGYKPNLLAVLKPAPPGHAYSCPAAPAAPPTFSASLLAMLPRHGVPSHFLSCICMASSEYDPLCWSPSLCRSRARLRRAARSWTAAPATGCTTWSGRRASAPPRGVVKEGARPPPLPLPLLWRESGCGTARAAPRRVRCRSRGLCRVTAGTARTLFTSW